MRKGDEFSFRFAELCLYEYQKNLKRLEKLRDELKSLSSMIIQNYDALGHNAPGDPVFQCMERTEELGEEISQLERKTEPVTRLAEALGAPYILDGTANEGLGELMRLWYFEKKPKVEIMEGLKVSKKTVYRMREKLVGLAIRYFTQ